MESGTCCSRPLSHTSQWVRFSGHFRHTCECSSTRSTFCTDAFTVFHLGVFFSRVNVCCAMVQAKCSHPFILLFLNSLIMGTAEEAAASDILVGAQPRIMCWTRARSSSSEVVDTATARRQPASGRRRACGTAVPISLRTARPRSTQRRHEVA